MFDMFGRSRGVSLFEQINTKRVVVTDGMREAVEVKMQNIL